MRWNYQNVYDSKGKILCFRKNYGTMSASQRFLHPESARVLRNNMKSYLLEQQHTKAHLIKDLILKLGRLPMNMKRGWKWERVNNGKCHEIFEFMARKEPSSFRTHCNCHRKEIVIKQSSFRQKASRHLHTQIPFMDSKYFKGFLLK